MALTLSCLLKLSLTLSVLVSCTVALPPSLFARNGQHEETHQDVPFDCSPRSDGSMPHGCADTVAGNSINYEIPGKEVGLGGVLDVVEGLDEGVMVMDDAQAGTYIIRVPQYQPLHRRGCPYRHVFVAELGMCIKESSFRQLSYKHPHLAARLLY